MAPAVSQFPAISVVVPVFNAEKYLSGCLESLKNQTFRNFEVLLVDDCSTDKSREICEKYVAEDSRFKLFIHRENRGPGAARNTALDVASGETVFFLDADDLLPATALGVLYAKYSQNLADIVVGSFDQFDDSGNQSEIIDDIPCGMYDISKVACHYLTQPNKSRIFAYSWGRLFKSSVLRSNALHFEQKMHILEDVAWNFRHACCADKILIIRETVYSYRIPSSSHVTMGKYNEMLLLTTPLILHRHIKKFLQAKKLNDYVSIADDCIINLIIIYIVRICIHLKLKTFCGVCRNVKKILKMKSFQNILKNYDSSPPGRSKLMPFFMKHKLVIPLLLLGKYKAWKRYKRGK